MNFLSLKVARRYIFSKKSYSAVNLISIVAVCGLVVTVAAMVCVLSVFNGFSNLIQNKLAGIDPDIKIVAVDGKVINNSDSIISIIKNIDGVALALPTIQDNALAMYGDKQLPVIVKGVPELYDSLTYIRSLIKEDGSYCLKDDIGNYTLMSIGTAVSLRAQPNFRYYVKIFAPRRKGNINLANPIGAFRSDSLLISGIYQIDQAKYDMNSMIVPLEVAKNLFDYDTEATNIEILVNEGFNISNVISAIQSKIGKKYQAQNRIMQQESAFKMINIEKWITFLLLGFIMIIATFNVISTVSILIVEKKKDIRTLRNLGASQSLVTRIFTSQTFLINLFGAIIGIAAGLILCLCQEYFGWIKLGGDPNALLVKAYPVVVRFSDILVVLALTALISLLSSFITSAIMRSRLK